MGKIKGSMWVGSEAEVGELGAGFGWEATRKLTWLGLVTKCGQGSGWDHRPSCYPQAELFVRQRERPGLPSQALAWPPRLSAGRRESGSQRPWLGEAAPQPEGSRCGMLDLSYPIRD